jgi:hypothetical protein
MGGGVSTSLDVELIKALEFAGLAFESCVVDFSDEFESLSDTIGIRSMSRVRAETHDRVYPLVAKVVKTFGD